MEHCTKLLLLIGALSIFSYAEVSLHGTKIIKVTSKIGAPEYLLVKRVFKTFNLVTSIENYKNYVLLVNYNKQRGNQLYKLLTDRSPLHLLPLESAKWLLLF
ncbi:MAG: hypothetical protein ACQPRJ_06520 [Solitalea-like symbiont of Acarus siro]